MKAMTFAKACLALTAGLLFSVAVANAQVAAPQLNDTAPYVGAPFNPAVLPLNQVSQIGATLIPDVTIEVEPAGAPVIEEATGDGNAVQLRLVGANYAFGAEALNVKTEDSPTAVIGNPGDTSEFSATLISLAGRLGDVLTIGLALESGKDTRTPAGGGAADVTESSMPVLGGTWRLGNVFYVGGTYGSETVTDTPGGGTSDEGDRAVTRVGVGVYSRNNDQGYHVEVYRENGDLLEIRDPAGVLQRAEEHVSTGINLEFMFSNWVFGVQSLKTTTDALPNGLPPVETEEEDERTFAIGWVPQQGLGVSVILSQNEITNSTAPGATVNLDFQAVAVSWIF